ncbi:alpha/beta hydrolase [Streptomyces niveus]|uniref:Alpha/beta hydrolase family protein n=1 Tax=Streptomyces niveus TaxID=193462 RepID=A0ABZ2A449_STRNV|nr:alpha/beta hydrolase [Streptomyces niveus]
MTGTAPTWQQLRDLKRPEFEDAGDGWHEVSGRADADRVRTDKAMTAKLRDTQDSESAKAALARLERLSRNYEYIHTESGLVRTTLNGLAAELADPQRELSQALEEAAGLKFTVHEDASISYPSAVVCGNPQFGETGEKKVPGGTALGSSRFPLESNPGLNGEPGFDYNPNPNAAMAQDIADRIARAVRSAAEIDRRYASALRKLKAAAGLDVTEATLKDMAGDASAVRTAAKDYLADNVPFDKSPAERKEWWDGLTEEQRREYLDVAPDLVGNLDGIPSLVRDEANRNYLPVLIDSLERQGDKEAETMLDGLRGIEEKLGKPTIPPMYLLGIGDEGNGRAIVAYGNPDTSKNVSAYVPGLATKLDGDFAGGTVQRALDTAIGAQGHDPSSASIVWLGYDAPQNVDVISTGDAERGAPAYNEFMNGLGVTNENKDPHLTAIGHSYGSLTVGTAAQQNGGIPGADDIILLGSPGVGVDKAEDLGVGKDHVYVGAADNDLVTQLPSKQQTGVGFIGAGAGPLGAYLLGDIADQGDDDLYFGKDPASQAFGANRFLVDDGVSILEGGKMSAHSQYFTPNKDSVSANNIALIVAGVPQEIKTEEWR